MLSRYHLRIFPINHAHAAVRERVSFMDVHHEHLTVAGDHVIDDDWENAESFLLLGLAAHHAVAADQLDHGAAGMFRGFFDDGLVSRIGGLHDGVYDPTPVAPAARRLAAGERVWADAPSGAFRVADADGTAVYDGRAYARRSRSGTSYVRIGSRRFLGRLATLVSPAQARPEEPRRRGLFSVGLDGATDVDRELAPGERSRLGVRAYWLGPAFGGLRAAAALDHWRVPSAAERAAGVPGAAQTVAHVVVYERRAAVGGAFVPGAAPPAGELQVVSLPRASTLVRRKLAAARSWPHRWVVLASGEPALASPLRYESASEGFELLTAGTFVTVIGDVGARDIPGVASRLRPL